MKKVLFIMVLSFGFLSANIYDLNREIVEFYNDKKPGSIVIKTHERKLYYIIDNWTAYEFPIAVGRRAKDRFYGVFPITDKAKWPSWRPTESMLEKEPNLPTVVKGGKRNPLGARALYLGDSAYRIHGTNNPSSIGTFASHGCIRMYNEDVKELYDMVDMWSMVYVQR
jgi:lipoprotein-anchoring transpeptidase ErfK/SrfK